jgi:hypothetical protein
VIVSTISHYPMSISGNILAVGYRIRPIFGHC